MPGNGKGGAPAAPGGGNGRPPGGGNGRPPGGGMGMPPGPGNGGRLPRPAPAWPGGATAKDVRTIIQSKHNNILFGKEWKTKRCGLLTRHTRRESPAWQGHRRCARHPREGRRGHAAREAEGWRERAGSAARAVGAGLVLW